MKKQILIKTTMMKKVKGKATVSLVRGVRKGSDLISIRVYFNGVRNQSYISTGVSVPKKYWLPKLKKIHPSMKNSIYLQEQLDTMIYRVNFALEKMNYEGIEITKENFIAVFRNEDKKTSIHKTGEQLVHLFCSKALELSNISEASKRAQKMTTTLIRQFNPTLTFNEIGYETAVAWSKFLNERYTNINTIAGHHKTFRKFLNEAEKQDLITSKQIRRFKELEAPRIKGTRTALYPKQVEAIQKLEYTPFSMMDNIRNMFLFGCYTGLRISDITTLQQKDIVEGDTRGVLINKSIYKLRHINRKVVLPIEKLFAGLPYEMVKKYREQYPDSNTIFPEYAHQVLNRYLKKVAYDAGITTPISFHYARHTFLTILAYKSKDLFAVMDYGGITSVNTAQGYIHVASQWLDEGLKSIDWSLGDGV